METFIKRFVFLLFFFFASKAAQSQDCDPAQLATIPGTYKAGIAGSVQNVSKTDLAKEKETLAKIHQQISSGFSPVGMEIAYSNAFGYNEFYGKNWVADPYYYGMYFLKYVCGKSKRNDRNYQPDVSSNTQVFIRINSLWAQNSPIGMPPADFPDDREEQYIIIKKWPEKKSEGYYLWTILDEKNWHTKEFIWLITKNEKLPFRALTKREFILQHLPKMKQSLKDVEGARSRFDPSESEEQKKGYDSFSSKVEKQQKDIDAIQNLLTTLSKAELEEPAIIESGQSTDEFLGFKKERDSDVDHLVVPDLGYFDPSLPKWVPQYICINFIHDTKNPVYLFNIDAIVKTLDIKFFQSLLVKP